MEYTIGDVARLMDLSVEGIRNYEKAGIITPSRTDSSYRKYRYLDVTSLVRARGYRALGFSLREIGNLTNHMNIREVCENLESRRKNIENDAALIRLRLNYLEQTVREMDQLEQRLDRPGIRMLDGCYRIEFSKNGVIDMNSGSVKVFQEWIRYVPFVHISSRYAGENTYGGLAIAEEYARYFGIRESEWIRYVPGGMGVYVYVREEENSYTRPECTDMIRKYADYHRYRLEENLLGHTLIGIHKRENFTRYREISAKILTDEA